MQQVFIPFSADLDERKLKHGGCCVTVARQLVALLEWVQLPPSAFMKGVEQEKVPAEQQSPKSRQFLRIGIKT